MSRAARLADWKRSTAAYGLAREIKLPLNSRAPLRAIHPWHNQKGVRPRNETPIVTRASRPCMLYGNQDKSIFPALQPSARAGRPCHIKGSESTNGAGSRTAILAGS